MLFLPVDCWRDVCSLSNIFRGISHCSVKAGDISIAENLENNDLAMHFALPLSLEAHKELHILPEHVNNIQREVLQLDEWSYAWGAKDFRAHKYYRHTTLFMGYWPWT